MSFAERSLISLSSEGVTGLNHQNRVKVTANIQNQDQVLL